MTEEFTTEKSIEEIIEEKINPFSLNRNEKNIIARLVAKYPHDILQESIDDGAVQYLVYDNNDNPIRQSIDIFFDKLGGIAFNKSLPPIKREILHLKNKGRYLFTFWREDIADAILYDYVKALENHYTEDAIIEDLKNEVSQLMNRSRNWATWTSSMRSWIDNINQWQK